MWSLSICENSICRRFFSASLSGSASGVCTNLNKVWFSALINRAVGDDRILTTSVWCRIDAASRSLGRSAFRSLSSWITARTALWNLRLPEPRGFAINTSTSAPCGWVAVGLNAPAPPAPPSQCRAPEASSAAPSRGEPSATESPWPDLDRPPLVSRLLVPGGCVPSSSTGCVTAPLSGHALPWPAAGGEASASPHCALGPLAVHVRPWGWVAAPDESVVRAPFPARFVVDAAARIRPPSVLGDLEGVGAPPPWLKTPPMLRSYDTLDTV
eukprot:CAMPEP_0173416420 /NCGR_PEP_ID=MMETSP1356-20130122/85378_1 /TAXON_ID=77927 ORGANISM="Hemiselmis virescens, Strain PCC157" /NCGR_SAMPLE_ID=MMETSP1356 /ASSEMBLY_ACC=CAM_ASM_000847 /LENGTH=269 /DNA_ID=CAMNT_0014378727 /DNA_START=690 /DNA_END=1499 /DNA_ORIENTATION=-